MPIGSTAVGCPWSKGPIVLESEILAQIQAAHFLVRHDGVRCALGEHAAGMDDVGAVDQPQGDRKSTRLNSSHANISYAVFCLKKKKTYLVTYSRATSTS